MTKEVKNHSRSLIQCHSQTGTPDWIVRQCRMEWLWCNTLILIKRNYLQVTAAFFKGFRLDLCVCWCFGLFTEAAVAAAASSTHKSAAEVEGPSSSDSTLEDIEGEEITDDGDDGGVEYNELPPDDKESPGTSGYSVRRTVRVALKSFLSTHSSSTLQKKVHLLNNRVSPLQSSL